MRAGSASRAGVYAINRRASRARRSFIVYGPRRFHTSHASFQRAKITNPTLTHSAMPDLHFTSCVAAALSAPNIFRVATFLMRRRRRLIGTGSRTVASSPRIFWRQNAESKLKTDWCLSALVQVTVADQTLTSCSRFVRFGHFLNGQPRSTCQTAPACTVDGQRFFR